MNKILYIFLVFIIGCKASKEETPQYFKKYNEILEIENQQQHENDRMKFKLIQSKYLDMNEVFLPFKDELAKFSEEEYNKLKSLVLEQNIPSLQEKIRKGKLTYERLTLFYLYRIKKFESDSTKSLNSVIALNPNVLKEARARDKNKSKNTKYSVFGMPILLKDNINTNNMPTTAGAVALEENIDTDDAFIVKKIKEKGALILGKVNLSEWAYFFCSGCPLGYSAIGGQTLNPYGRKIFETGGSSSGSGVVVAANYAVAAVGTETSGSITSPSSQNSVVGLKPTIGLLSRTGIVPISSTLDTPGPMTKSVLDNSIFLEAMLGFDENDNFSVNKNFTQKDFQTNLINSSLKGKRLGVLKGLLTDSIYSKTIKTIKKAGGIILELSPDQMNYKGFLTFLNIDMKNDLPRYLAKYADKNVKITSVKDVIDFNLKDSTKRAPYGQQLFDGIIKDSTTLKQLETIKQNLNKEGKKYLTGLYDNKLDAILSINNYHSGVASMANYPTLTVPMGYKANGEPISLTFIGKPFTERNLLKIGYAFEQLTKIRKLPKNYK